jgi:hypothetical protein
MMMITILCSTGLTVLTCSVGAFADTVLDSSRLWTVFAIGCDEIVFPKIPPVSQTWISNLNTNYNNRERVYKTIGVWVFGGK